MWRSVLFAFCFHAACGVAVACGTMCRDLVISAGHDMHAIELPTTNGKDNDSEFMASYDYAKLKDGSPIAYIRCSRSHKQSGVGYSVRYPPVTTGRIIPFYDGIYRVLRIDPASNRPDGKAVAPESAQNFSNIGKLTLCRVSALPIASTVQVPEGGTIRRMSKRGLWAIHVTKISQESGHLVQALIEIAVLGKSVDGDKGVAVNYTVSRNCAIAISSYSKDGMERVVEMLVVSDVAVSVGSTGSIGWLSLALSK